MRSCNSAPCKSFFFKILLPLAFCLAAANDGLVGANNGLVGANDSLAAANNKLLRRKAFVCAFSQKEIRSKGRRKRDSSKKNSCRRLDFSPRGRWKRGKTGPASAQNRNRAVRVVFLPIFLPRFHFQKVFYLLFLQQQFATLPPSGLRRLFSITF